MIMDIMKYGIQAVTVMLRLGSCESKREIWSENGLISQIDPYSRSFSRNNLALFFTLELVISKSMTTVENSGLPIIPVR